MDFRPGPLLTFTQMRTNNESEEDIYNSLPVECFTFDSDNDNAEEQFSITNSDNSFDSEPSESSPQLKDLFLTEETLSENDFDTDIKNLDENFNGNDDSENIALLPPPSSPSPNTSSLEQTVHLLEKLEIDFKEQKISKPEAIQVPVSVSLPVPVPQTPIIEDENKGIWVRCTRCGKKNEIDCNFCGKCGLQIHKIVSIVEPETEKTLDPEASQNIKYHYKRPVFCFGPKGNCFASFSSPSKSVRNVAKFRLSTLSDFENLLTSLRVKKHIISDYSTTWTGDQFKNPDWAFKTCVLRDFSSIIATQPNFELNQSLRALLQEYFAGIVPKDLGSIKSLAMQENVKYSRDEINGIFHQLVLGRTMEACELSIKFNYWDHALIIAKTLQPSFYEQVMNRFLNARFLDGHPLRILYLIMTNNENSALEEIRNMITSEDLPLFVQEIWTVLINFLLRAKNESVVISKIFEDIANCLFDKNLYENALICYIIAILSIPAHLTKPELFDRVDYLLASFLKDITHDSINYSGILILTLFIEKINSAQPRTIMWRCQFIILSFAQYIYDLDAFDPTALSFTKTSVDLIKNLNLSQRGYVSLLNEEFMILTARVSLPSLLQSDEKNGKKTVATNFNNFTQTNINTKIAAVNTISPSPIITNNYSSNYTFEPVQYEVNYPEQQPSPSYSPHEDSTIIGSTTTSSPIGIEESTRSTATASAFIDDLGFDTKPKPKSNPILNDNDEVNNSDSAASKSSEKQKQPQNQQSQTGVYDKLKNWWPSTSKTQNQTGQGTQKKVIVANIGKPNSWRYDAKLKRWVDDNDPSTFEEAPKIAPPPITSSNSSTTTTATTAAPSGSAPDVMNFRAKKGGKVKYFDPLNPEGPTSTQLQPSVPNFDL